MRHSATWRHFKGNLNRDQCIFPAPAPPPANVPTQNVNKDEGDVRARSRVKMYHIQARLFHIN